MATLGFPALPTRGRLPKVARAKPPFRRIFPRLTSAVIAALFKAYLNQVFKAVRRSTTASHTALYARGGDGECETITTSSTPPSATPLAPHRQGRCSDHIQGRAACSRGANHINVILLIVPVALADPAGVRLARLVSCGLTLQDRQELTGAYDLLHHTSISMGRAASTSG